MFVKEAAMSPFPGFQVQLEMRVSVQLLRPPSSAALTDLVLVARTGRGHLTPLVQFSSVQFSRPVMFDSLWPHGLQHTRPPCPSPTPGVYSNSCPLSWWCHPSISSSVVPFSSCPQSFLASASFPMSRLFASGDQSIGASASLLPIFRTDFL